MRIIPPPGGGSTNAIPYDGASTWAARGSGSANGALKTLTHASFPGGQILASWDLANTLWRSAQGIIRFAASPALTTSGVGDANEQSIKSTPVIPAGALYLGRKFTLDIKFSKNGATNTQTNRGRVGALGTPADTLLVTPFAFAAANRTVPFKAEYWLPTATTMRLYSNNNVGQAAWIGSVTNNAEPVDVTTPDATTTDLYFTATTQLNGATDRGEVAALAIEVIP